MSATGTATTTRTASQRAVPHPHHHLGHLGHLAGGRPVRRVRHEVRDGLAVVLFSALTSSGLALLLTVLARLGN